MRTLKQGTVCLLVGSLAYVGSIQEGLAQTPPAAPAPAAPGPASAAPAPMEGLAPVASKDEAPKAPAAPETPPPPAPAPGIAPAGTPPMSVPPVVGRSSFHPFDKIYFLAGGNLQLISDHGSILEGELSVVPWISDSLAWLGFWGSAGGRLDTDGYDGRFRTGGGLEMGWRFLAVDAGYVLDSSKPESGERESLHGFRVRVGGAVAVDLGASRARYTRACCVQNDSLTTCECDRNPWGLSGFVYYAHETRPVFENGDGMFGLSLKLGVGVL